MFKKNVAISFFFFLSFFALWLYQTAIPHSTDLKNYQHILNQKKHDSSHNFSPTNQYRKNVQKDLWVSQIEGKRLHYQIASESSLLTFIPIKNKFEIIETLKGLKCWMQDKLLFSEIDNAPMQQARFIEAKEGIYRFTTHELVANDVFLSLFRLPGHVLPQKPLNKDDAYLQGIARNISCFLGGKTSLFQAEQFEAIMVKE